MNKPIFLGETPVTDLDETPFKGFGPKEWALHYIERYGQIDGGHHKTWVLDQVARILNGAPIILTLAKWSSGKAEYRVQVGEPTERYRAWVGDEEGYDCGIAP